MKIAALKPLFFIVCFIFSVSEVTAKDNWELSKKEQGISIFVSKNTHSAMKSFRAEMIVNSRLSALVKVLDDSSIYPNLFHNCKSAKTLKVLSKVESYRYMITSMPWPVKNRDFIVHSKLQQNQSNKQVVISVNAKPDYLAQKAGMVRIRNMKARWTFTPMKAGQVRVVYEVNVDPAGNLPKWLVNVMAVDVPFYTLRNLRQLVKSSDYQSAKLDYIRD